MLRNWHTIFIKTIDINLWVADAHYNKTIKDYYWELPPNSLAGAMYIDDIELTPHESGWADIYIHADYQYEDWLERPIFVSLFANSTHPSWSFIFATCSPTFFFLSINVANPFLRFNFIS